MGIKLSATGRDKIDLDMRVNNLTKEIFWIMVDTGVRYWNDSEVNGNDDVDLYETKGDGSPLMPCASQIKVKPVSCIYSDHWRWRPIINIETGQIKNWQKGVTANVHYKVCDDFACSFVDGLSVSIAEYDGYVPSFMCTKGEGYGDYIIMDIDENGFIQNWNSLKVKKFVEQMND